MTMARRSSKHQLVRMGFCADGDAGEALNARFSPAGLPWAPNADVVVKEEEILVRLELPGADIDELTVVQDGRRLVVQGVRPRPADEASGEHHIMEIQYGPFARIFEFPAFVRLDGVRAAYENGFLAIRLSKCVTPPAAAVSARIVVSRSRSRRPGGAKRPTELKGPSTE